MNNIKRRTLGLFLSGVGIVSAAFLFGSGVKKLDKELYESLKKQSVVYEAILDYAMERRLYQECIRMEQEEMKRNSLEIRDYIIGHMEQNAGKEHEMLPEKGNFLDRG